MAMNPTIDRSTKDRRLYTWVAVFVPVIVLIGFARSYYLKGFFNTPAIPSLLVHLHGIVMTSWVVLFVVQVSLVAKSSPDPNVPMRSSDSLFDSAVERDIWCGTSRDLRYCPGGGTSCSVRSLPPAC